MIIMMMWYILYSKINFLLIVQL